MRSKEYDPLGPGFLPTWGTSDDATDWRIGACATYMPIPADDDDPGLPTYNVRWGEQPWFVGYHSSRAIAVR